MLGGNEGSVEESAERLRRAVELLAQRAGEVVRSSAMEQTEPWGFECSDRFVNQGVELLTELEAEKLLDITQSIEQELGRSREAEQRYKQQRGQRYAPRAIDIDIILYGDLTITSKRLEVPHPRMCEREFVLRPLSEIAPQRLHPQRGLTIAELLQRL